MLNYLKNESNMTYTENGGTAYRSSESFCLDMFFKSSGSCTNIWIKLAGSGPVIQTIHPFFNSILKLFHFSSESGKLNL